MEKAEQLLEIIDSAIKNYGFDTVYKGLKCNKGKLHKIPQDALSNIASFLGKEKFFPVSKDYLKTIEDEKHIRSLVVKDRSFDIKPEVLKELVSLTLDGAKDVDPEALRNCHLLHTFITKGYVKGAKYIKIRKVFTLINTTTEEELEIDGLSRPHHLRQLREGTHMEQEDILFRLDELGLTIDSLRIDESEEKEERTIYTFDLTILPRDLEVLIWESYGMEIKNPPVMLERFPNLKELSFKLNQKDFDFDKLNELTGLRKLHIRYFNKEAVISKFNKLVNLRDFKVVGNQIRIDTRELFQLTNMTNLSIIEEMSGGLASLKLSSIRGLNNMVNLKSLTLIASIDYEGRIYVESTNRLTKLEIFKISDLNSTLTVNAPNLKTVLFKGSSIYINRVLEQISDKRLESLSLDSVYLHPFQSSIKTLKYLYIGNPKIIDDEIKEVNLSIRGLISQNPIVHLVLFRDEVEFDVRRNDRASRLDIENIVSDSIEELETNHYNSNFSKIISNLPKLRKLTIYFRNALGMPMRYPTTGIVQNLRLKYPSMEIIDEAYISDIPYNNLSD